MGDTDTVSTPAADPATIPVQTSNADRVVPTRRISFDEAVAAVPKHFGKDGNVVVSHLIASLSSVFPDGEDFFVRSVRHYRKEITDPALKRQVNGFIGQEAMHGREHRVLNDHLASLGFRTKQGERFAKNGLAFRWKHAPKISNLALTAALEHFTATLAELVMREPEIRDLIGDPTIQEIFLWHALEESEHKAVAFDVYKAVGGSERLRVWTMKVNRFGFLAGMSVQTAISLAKDREARGRIRKDFRAVRKSPLVTRAVWRQLRDYDRPDFHPDDSNTDEILAEWTETLFGASGQLNDKLAGAAA